MTLIDSHAHLNFEGSQDDLSFSEVAKIINVGTTLVDSEQAVKLAQKHENIFASVGIHPHESCDDFGKLESLAKEEKVVAIGECGLDYSRLPDDQTTRLQKDIFQKQIEIAEKLKLPLIIHVRDAQEELISVFGHKLAPMRGVFHCFSGDENYLATILKLMPGFYISFAGNITYKSAQTLRDLARATPLERMLVETDSPFLTPEPLRGERNSPVNVKIVAMKIAELKGVTQEKIAEITTMNTERLFDI